MEVHTSKFHIQELRQENRCEFQATLDYIVSSRQASLKTNKQTNIDKVFQQTLNNVRGFCTSAK